MTRTLALTLALALSLAWPAAGQDELRLERVGTQLARLGKSGGLYAYLRSEHPALFGVAGPAGLAAALDGELPRAEFLARLQAAIPAELAAEVAALTRVLSQLTPSGLGSGPSAKVIATEADLVGKLRTALYDGNAHWMTELWGPERRRTIGVRFLPGKLVWFNPSISIPELGIKAGIPLTPAQEQAVVRLFCLRTVMDLPGPAEGTAAFPSHVGRAVNPTSHVLTVINGRGEVLGDIVSKGTGRNADVRTGRRSTGTFETSEGVLDGELSRNLERVDVRDYGTLAVIVPDDQPKETAIQVRVPRSLLRHLDVDELSDEELRRTMERFLKELAIREGKPSISLAEWVSEYLPRTSGRNWGLLAGLGLEHGSTNGRDNTGLASETVDWGRAVLKQPGQVDERTQKDQEWRNIEATLNRMRRLYPGELANVSTSQVRRAFEEGYGQGKLEGLSGRLKLDPKALAVVSDADLYTLVFKKPKRSGRGLNGAVQLDQDRAAILSEAIRRGLLVESLDLNVLSRLPLEHLEALAEKNGVALPADGSREAVLVALTGKPVAEVRAVAGRGPIGSGALERARERLRDRLRRRR